MKSFNILIVFLFIHLHSAPVSGITTRIPFDPIRKPGQQDTLIDNQHLYNGKIWRNLYYQVQENQFLFSNEFLHGSLSISGKVFNSIDLKYDIFKDELLTPVEKGIILQLNKEMIDSFSIDFQNTTYRFIKMKSESGPGGYYNVLYKGKTGLYLKYYKKIDKLAVEGQYDKSAFQITGKGDLMKTIDDQKDLVKTFIKKNKFNVSDNIPESFIPILRYYDGLSQ
jgi:hypothetical protein